MFITLLSEAQAQNCTVEKKYTGKRIKCTLVLGTPAKQMGNYSRGMYIKHRTRTKRALYELNYV